MVAQLGVDEPPMNFQQALSAFATPAAANTAPLLPWVRVVCQNRQLFRHALFRLKADGSEEILRYSWAMQNPLVLGLVYCEVSPMLARNSLPFDMMGRADLFEDEYQLIPNIFKFSDKVGDLDPAATVEVKQLSTHPSAFVVGTDCEWEPFESAMASMGIQQRSGGTSARPPLQRPQPPDASLVMQNPWLLDLFGGVGGASSSGSRRPAAPSPVPDNDQAQHDDSFSPRAVEAAFDALHQRRAEVAVADAASDGFSWTVLGGKWTMQNRGVAFDSYRGQPSSKTSKDWAASHNMQTSATFSLAKYGPEVCAIMVQYWTDKMNHYYRVSKGQRAPAYQFSEQDLASFVEEDEFASLFGSAPRAVAQRAQALRDLRPR